jgi:hypothetical protein
MGSRYSKLLLDFHAKIKDLNDNFDVELDDDAPKLYKREYEMLKEQVVKFHKETTFRWCPFRSIPYLIYRLTGKNCRNKPVPNLFDEIEAAVKADLESLEKMDRTSLRLHAIKLAEESASDVSGDDVELKAAGAKVIAAAKEYAKAPKTHVTGWEDDVDRLVPAGPVNMRQMCLRAVHMNFAYECQIKCGFEPDDRDPGDDEELLAEAALIAAALEYNAIPEKDDAVVAPVAKRARV